MEGDGKAQMRPGLLDPAEAGETETQREMAVVSRRVHLEQRLEGLRRPRMLAAVEVRPPERLEDRALALFQPGGSLQDHRRLGVVAVLEQGGATLQQLVGRLVGGALSVARVGGTLSVARVGGFAGSSW